MKFQCERCKTRYSIADEKVRGKILKIRCKTCEAVITVRDGDGDPAARLVPEAASRPVVSTAGGKGRVRPAVKTIELASVTGSMAAQPPPAPSGASAAAARAAKADEGEWYLSVDGTQDG